MKYSTLRKYTIIYGNIKPILAVTYKNCFNQLLN